VVRKRPGPPSRSRGENTYLDSQIKAALQKPVFTNGEVVLFGQRRYTIPRAKQELGRPSFKIWMRWRKRCDLLGGKPIKVYRSIPGVFPLKTCSAQQIDTLKKRLADVRETGRFECWNGHGKLEVCISWAVAEAMLTQEGKLLVRRTYVYGRWHTEGCPFLDGKIVRIRTFDFSKENWFIEDHIEAIRKGLADKLAAQVRRDLADLFPEDVAAGPRKKTALQLFIEKCDGTFDEKGGKRYLVRTAAKLIGMGRVTLFGYLDAIPPESGLCGLFENDKVPSDTRLVPGTTNLRLETIHEDDVAKLRDARVKVYDGRVQPSEEEKSANQICDLKKIVNKGDRILVNSLLVEALAGAPVKRISSCRRGFTPTVTYRLSDVDELENRLGQDLLEIARRFRNRQAEIRQVVGSASENEQGQPGDQVIEATGRGTPTPEGTEALQPENAVHEHGHRQQHRQVPGPHGLVLFPDEHKAERGGKVVDFGSAAIEWRMLELLCERHPDFFRGGDLGHAACNPNSNGNEPEELTIWVHVSLIRKRIKRLGLEPKNTRGLGYRIELRRKKRSSQNT